MWNFIYEYVYISGLALNSTENMYRLHLKVGNVIILTEWITIISDEGKRSQINVNVVYFPVYECNLFYATYKVQQTMW